MAVRRSRRRSSPDRSRGRLTVERYLELRLGPGSVPRKVLNLVVRPFTASSLRKFWWYWNPGYGYYLLEYCYRPLRRFVPSALALLLTFAACGFFLHDVFYLAPLALRSGGIGFPFVTCWFAIIAVALLGAEALGLDFEPVSRPLRVPLHLGFLGATFWLAWRLSGLW